MTSGCSGDDRKRGWFRCACGLRFEAEVPPHTTDTNQDVSCPRCNHPHDVNVASPPPPFVDVSYEVVGDSLPLRLSKHVRVF